MAEFGQSQNGQRCRKWDSPKQDKSDKDKALKLCLYKDRMYTYTKAKGGIVCYLI